MTYAVAGYQLTGRIVGRSWSVDRAGRRCYLLLCSGRVYEVSGDLLREAVG